MPKMSETPPRLEHLGAALGQHTEDVFRQLLGLSSSDLEGLRSSNVI
jgi:formyl-CoA transferase